MDQAVAHVVNEDTRAALKIKSGSRQLRRLQRQLARDQGNCAVAAFRSRQGAAHKWPPFRVTILATDMFPEDQPVEVSELHPATSLDGLLPRIHILILCLPLTDQTRGMIDARRLALLPPGSILINVARGPLVVERDLVAALKSGHLFGAGLDVMEVEPPPIDSPIWDLPNVLITPHVGAQSLRRRDVTVRLMAENLARYARGEPLKHVADKEARFSAPRPVSAPATF